MDNRRKRVWLLMAVTLLCIHPVAAWSDSGYSKEDPCGTGLLDNSYPDGGISDLDQIK